MKISSRLPLITLFIMLIAGSAWAKHHSTDPSKKDGTAVCQKAACDSTDMAKCKDDPKKGCCAKDSTAVCHQSKCDSAKVAKCGHGDKMESRKKDKKACHKADGTAKCDSTLATQCGHDQKAVCDKKDDKACGAAVEQTTCPVMGNPINKDIFVEHNGKKVYFCCESCKAEFLKDPDKYLKKK